MGEKRDYLTIKILHNELTVMVPCENAGMAGLRRVIDEDEIKKVMGVLTDDVSEMPKNWNRRFKYNREKIKTGDVFELAEVVRNLAIREMEKGLSTGEKQMYTRAKKILASEFMYALDKDEDGRGGVPRRRCWRSASPPRAHRPDGRHRAVIAAAGSGERLGAGGPKAFVAAGRAGRWSSGRWPPSRRLRSVGPDRRGGAAGRGGASGAAGARRSAVVAGGATRSESVAAALEAVDDRAGRVHDAARPLVTAELIDAVVAELASRTDLDGRDRRGAGHRHDQAGRRGPGRSTATVDRAGAVGGADAAGLPRRGAARGAQAEGDLRRRHRRGDAGRAGRRHGR